MIAIEGLTLHRDGPDGDRTVIADVDVRLDRGERLALLGGNGSGKTSLLRHLAVPGVVPGARVALVCQDPDEQLVATTVGRELSLGLADSDIRRWLDEFSLTGLADVDPRLLSAGQKQRLQVATVLSRSPDLILLDEPGSLQDASQRRWLRDRLAAWPGTMILATQDRAEAALCGRALLLEAGRTIAAGAVATVTDAAALRGLWPDPLPVVAAPSAPDAPEVITLQGVSCDFHRGGLEAVSLRARAGERIGLVGPNGSGKSTLLAIMAGLRPPRGGTVELVGRRLYTRDRPDLDHGLVAFSPQFPEYQFAAATIAEEAAIGGLDPGAVLACAGLPADRAPMPPHALSGGQRRRLALALALGAGRPVVLVDEPTAGLDAASRREVCVQLSGVQPPTALVIASHDHELLAACGCRVVELPAA